MVTRFSGGRSRNTQREPPTMDKQLVNFVTCRCKSSAPFFVIYPLMFPDHEKKIKEYEQFTDNEGQMMAIVHVTLLLR
jgi:hypothetical protein